MCMHVVLNNCPAIPAATLCADCLPPNAFDLPDALLLAATDGEANVGPETADDILPSLHSTLRSGPNGPHAVTTHCFGVGHGHDAKLLQAISESAQASRRGIPGEGGQGESTGRTQLGHTSHVDQTCGAW